MPRLARLDAPGVLHHIIIRGIERKKIFSDTSDHKNFVGRLARLVPETQTLLLRLGFDDQSCPLSVSLRPDGDRHADAKIVDRLCGQF